MLKVKKGYNEVETLDAINRFIERRQYLVVVINREDIHEEMKEQYRQELGEVAKRHDALSAHAHQVAIEW